jgi:methionine biosynthesis protein MetW
VPVGEPISAPAHADRSIPDSRVDQYFAGGDLVVDLGCGDGSWIEAVGSRYARAVGIDISADRVTLSGDSRETWEFIKQDLNEGQVPLPDGGADGVRANQVIEHVANPLRFLAEAHRILRPGGVFVATTPNIRYLRHLVRLVISGHGPITSGRALRTLDVWDDGHIHFFTARDLEWLAKATGFSRVETSVLIAPTGRGVAARRFLNTVRGRGLVKGFLGGSIMVVAWK